MNRFGNCQNFRQFSFHFKMGGLLLTYVLLSSCVRPGESQTNPASAQHFQSNQYIENEILCRGGEKASAHIKALGHSIQQFADQSREELQSLSRSAPLTLTKESIRQEFEHFLDLTFPLVGKKRWGNVHDPQVYSYKHLKARLSRLKSSVHFFSKEFGNESYNLVRDFRKQWSKELTEIQQMHSRLKSFKCRLNRMAEDKEKDVRGLVKMLESSCPEKDWVSSKILSYSKEDLEECAKKSKQSSSQFHDQFLKLCSKIYDKKRCQRRLAWDEHLRRGTYPQTIILQAFERHLKSYFELSSPQQENVQCRRVANQDVPRLEVLVNMNENVREEFAKRGVRLQNLKRKVERTWGESKELAIELVNDSGGIQIVFEGEKSVSQFIDHRGGQKTIKLSSELQGGQLEAIFTHEFGHALGFPDCYLEFYRHDENQLTYYELGQKEENLMCTLRFGNRVPSSYRSQLKMTYCQSLL